MATEIFSENPNMNIMSPRISFSHNLSQSDTVPIKQYILRSHSLTSSDFNFAVSEESDHGSCSADELFADGKIIPSEIKVTKSKSYSPKTEETVEKSTPVAEKPNLSENDQKKSFWGFKRSSSLNCGSGYARSLCLLPPLSRSNSTGSNSVKKSSISKDGLKANSQRQSNLYQKPPLRKNGIRVNPVLNVPSSNMFGLGSIFSGNKNKSKKK